MTERFGQTTHKGDTIMLTRTKIALATALILGTASAALANDIDVNPSSAQSAKEWQQFLGHGQTGTAGAAFGYVASPKQAHRASHEQTQDR
jgi:hypothetical protein